MGFRKTVKSESSARSLWFHTCPANGRDVCYIGAATQPNANEIFERVEPIMKALGGWPHWGKCFSLRRAEAEGMYPGTYEKFRKLRATWDPKGVFSNELMH